MEKRRNEMTPEQQNLCREIIRAVLYHARESDSLINSYKSALTLCYTADEKKEMERIINEHRN
jgi:hypothetical protein